MVSRRALVFPTLISWVVLLGACAAPALKPNGQVTARLESHGQRVTLVAKLGNEVVLQLPPVADPGYSWQIASQDARFLKQLNDFQPSANAAAGPTIRFMATRVVSRTLVRFLLAPPAGKETRPVDAAEVVVTVQPGGGA